MPWIISIVLAAGLLILLFSFDGDIKLPSFKKRERKKGVKPIVSHKEATLPKVEKKNYSYEGTLATMTEPYFPSEMAEEKRDIAAKYVKLEKDLIKKRWESLGF